MIQNGINFIQDNCYVEGLALAVTSSVLVNACTGFRLYKTQSGALFATINYLVSSILLCGIKHHTGKDKFSMPLLGFTENWVFPFRFFSLNVFIGLASATIYNTVRKTDQFSPWKVGLLSLLGPAVQLGRLFAISFNDYEMEIYKKQK